MMNEFPPDIDYSKLTIAEQQELSWFRSPRMPDDPLGLSESNLGQIMSLLLGIREKNTHGG